MKILKNSVAAAVFLLLAAVFFILIIPRVAHIQSLNRRSQEIDRELAQLKLRNQRLETELRLLREDPVYLEKVAREKLNKAKEGEIVYRVIRGGESGAEKKSSN